MDKQILKIIEREPKEVLGGLLLDLIQMDNKNKDRILMLYHKY